MQVYFVRSKINDESMMINDDFFCFASSRKKKTKETSPLNRANSLHIIRPLLDQQHVDLWARRDAFIKRCEFLEVQ